MKLTKIMLAAMMLAASSIATAQQTAATSHVLPSKYAGYHTLTHFDSTSVYMEESGLSYMEGHRLVEMLDYAGCRNNNVVKMDYAPLSDYVEIRQVLVHRYYGDRTDTIVDQATGRGTVYDYVAPARRIYWGASQKMVEVGHLDPRDQLEIRTFRKGYTYALLSDDDSRYIPPMRGHFYDIVPFWSSEPIIAKVYSVNVLTNKNLRFQIYNEWGGMHIDTLRLGDRTRYTFSRFDIMPLKREPAALADNDMQCKLLLSTSPNWEAKSMWFYGVNEDYGSFRPTAEVRAKVRELLQGATSELDSISSLTHWVADNIRYCGISMGEGEGYTLHNAEMNFTDRCGVCKDKASMLVCMLRAAGFKSYAAMTMAGERIDHIPADQFNHSVCVVQRRNGQYELLDPTWVPNVRELWSSAEQQQGYLIGLPNGTDLMETPTSPAENHYIRITGNSKIKSNGTLVGTITITAEGQSDAAVRRVFNARQSEWAANLELELLRLDPRAQIKKVTHTDNDRYLEQPVSITYQFTIPDYAIIDGDQLAFIPLTARNFYSRAMLHLNLDTTLTQRSQPFKDRCSRLVEIKETITLPGEYKHMDYGAKIEGVVSPAVNFGCGFDLNGHTLTFGESAMYNKRIYGASEWPAFRQAIIGQQTVAVTPVILHKK